MSLQKIKKAIGYSEFLGESVEVEALVEFFIKFYR